MRILPRTALVLSTFTAASLLVACGGSSGGGGASAANSKITLTEEDYYGVSGPDNPGGTAYDKVIAAFEALHPNITIKRIQVPQPDMVSKVALQATTHSVPNIVLGDNPMTPPLAATGAFVPLNSLGKIDTSLYAEAPLSTGMYNNQLYGMTVGNNGLGLFYNKKLLAARGVTPPKTWDELRAAAKTLKNGKVSGLEWVSVSSEEGTWSWLPFLWSAGGDLKNVNTDAGRSAFAFVANLTKDGSVPKSIVNMDDGTLEKDFSQGNSAMVIDGSWDIPLYAGVKGLDYGFVAIPTPTGQAPVVPLGGEVMMIGRSKPAQERASYEFLSYMTGTPEVIGSFDAAFGFVPALKSAAETSVQNNPELDVFRQEFLTGRARSEGMGTKYYDVAQLAIKQVQAALLGTATPEAAASTLSDQVSGVLK